MAQVVLDLDDELYEVLSALGREHGYSVEEESSLLLSEAGWREQAIAAVAGRQAEGAGEHGPS